LICAILLLPFLILHLFPYVFTKAYIYVSFIYDVIYRCNQNTKINDYYCFFWSASLIFRPKTRVFAIRINPFKGKKRCSFQNLTSSTLQRSFTPETARGCLGA